MNYKKTIIIGLLVIAAMIPVKSMHQAQALPTQQTTLKDLTDLAVTQQLYNVQESMQGKTIFVQHIMNQIMLESWNSNFTIQDQMTILYNLKFTLLANLQTLTKQNTKWLGFLSTNNNDQMIDRLQLLISEIDKKIIELEFKAESWASYLTRNTLKYGTAAIIVALATWQAKNLAQETRLVKWLTGTNTPSTDIKTQEIQKIKEKRTQDFIDNKNTKTINHLLEEREAFIEETDRNAQLIENLEDVIQTAQQKLAHHEEKEALTDEQQETIEQLRTKKLAVEQTIKKISHEQKYNLAKIEELLNRQLINKPTTAVMIDQLKLDYAKLSDESQRASLELKKAQEDIEQFNNSQKKTYEGLTLFGDEPLITGRDITEFTSKLSDRVAKSFEKIHPDPSVDYGYAYDDETQPGASMTESINNATTSSWKNLLEKINNQKA